VYGTPLQASKGDEECRPQTPFAAKFAAWITCGCAKRRAGPKGEGMSRASLQSSEVKSSKSLRNRLVLTPATREGRRVYRKARKRWAFIIYQSSNPRG
jgi:hypothetical protein